MLATELFDDAVSTSYFVHIFHANSHVTNEVSRFDTGLPMFLLSQQLFHDSEIFVDDFILM